MYNGKFILLVLILLPSFILSKNVKIVNGDNNSYSSSEEPLNYGCRNIVGCGPDESKEFLIFLVILFLSVVMIFLLSSNNIHILPESIAVVILGVIYGIIDKYTPSHILDIIGSFNVERYELILAPIIFFEAGFTIPKKDFFRNLPIILILAIIGTTIQFLIAGLGIYGLGLAHLSTPRLSIREGLILGALGSATDPISTLAVFKALDVDTRLYIIILGESILNESVSLITLQSIMTYSIGEIWIPLLLFLAIYIGSILIGVILTLILSLFLKLLPIGKYPALETIFIILFAYISYLICDSIGFSGTLSSFSSGVTMSQYVYNGLTKITKNTITQVIRAGAFIGETVAFLYIGISLPIHDFHVSMSMVGWTFLLFIVARAISIFPAFLILNKFKIQPHISGKFQFVIWFAALRGPTSFAELFQPHLNDYTNSAYIKTTILLFIYFTLFIFGILSFPLVRLLKIKMNDREQTLESINIIHYEKEKYESSIYRKVDNVIRKLFSRLSPPPVEVEVHSEIYTSSSSSDYIYTSDETESTETFDSFDIRNSI